MELVSDNYFEIVREALNGAERVKLAVAFWGSGASAALDLGRTGRPTLIVCNLMAGGTNPYEIEQILDLPHVVVKHHSHLHAKLFWTPTCIVVGSANASSNGLSLEGSEQSAWIELALRTEDPDAIGQAERWFDTLWESAREVQKTDLALAAERWEQRRRRRPDLARREGDTLLETLLRHPERLRDRNIYFALYDSQEISQLATQGLEEARAVSHDNRLNCYEDWEELPLGAEVIDLPIGRGGQILMREISHWQTFEASAVVQLNDSNGNQTSITLCHPIDDPVYPLSVAEKRRLKESTVALRKFAEPTGGVLSLDQVRSALMK